ncbi:MAG: site-specific integrase [Hyphomicrobiaceae bacterium]
MAVAIANRLLDQAAAASRSTRRSTTKYRSKKYQSSICQQNGETLAVSPFFVSSRKQLTRCEGVINDTLNSSDECKQMALRVKIALCSNGERLPLLTDVESGVPLFLPTVYCMTALRSRSLAVNTIDQATRAILLLYASTRSQGFELEERISAGRALNLSEIERLAADARTPMGALTSAEAESLSQTCGGTIARKLERSRRGVSGQDVQEVGLAFSANRLRYIRDYLNWMCLHQAAHTPAGGSRHDIDAARKQMVEMLDARIPVSGASNVLNAREGMPTEAVDRLRAVIDVDAHDNPWEDPYVRHRNQLIVLWALYLGLRRGEMLGIRIDDIDFQKHEVTIKRRADDKFDPRKNQPNTKTRDRKLALTDELVRLTEDYVMKHRLKVPGARKCPFLFVAARTGRPLSIPAMTKVYAALRERHREVFRNFTWHVLRHTWNDRFSEIMDDRDVPEELEKKQRSYLMGWSETSGTAATYTRRHVREKAKKASLDLQLALVQKTTNDSK